MLSFSATGLALKHNFSALLRAFLVQTGVREPKMGLSLKMRNCRSEPEVGTGKVPGKVGENPGSKEAGRMLEFGGVDSGQGG
jgi:hypothetical protein